LERILNSRKALDIKKLRDDDMFYGKISKFLSNEGSQIVMIIKPETNERRYS
jgi:hypothetical protein